MEKHAENNSSIERKIIECIRNTSFKDGTKLMEGDPGIIWRALREIACTNKDSGTIEPKIGSWLQEIAI